MLLGIIPEITMQQRHDPAELVWPPLALILRIDHSICFLKRIFFAVNSPNFRRFNCRVLPISYYLIYCLKKVDFSLKTADPES